MTLGGIVVIIFTAILKTTMLTKALLTVKDEFRGRYSSFIVVTALSMNPLMAFLLGIALNNFSLPDILRVIAVVGVVLAVALSISSKFVFAKQ